MFLLPEKLKISDILTFCCLICVSVLFQDYQDLEKNMKNEGNLLNNSLSLNESFIIFNRVPKAGSETLWKMLDILGANNHFKVYADDPEMKNQRGENTFIQKKEEQNYVQMFDKSQINDINLTLPFVYVKHINFLNFEQFGKQQPLFINMVRHPVERTISWFYYIRQGWYQLQYDPRKNSTNLKSRISPPGFYKYSYEECFNASMPECIYPVEETVHNSRYGGSHKSQVSGFLTTLLMFKLLMFSCGTLRNPVVCLGTFRMLRNL